MTAYAADRPTAYYLVVLIRSYSAMCFSAIAAWVNFPATRFRPASPIRFRSAGSRAGNGEGRARATVGPGPGSSGLLLGEAG